MQLELVLPILLFSAAVTVGADVQCQTACEHSKVRLSCHKNDVIFITSSMYGRKESSTCPSSSKTPNTDCRAANSMAEVDRRCGGKRKCSVKASNKVFGDPCDGTEKYLKVCYKCGAPVQPPGEEELALQQGNGDVDKWIQTVDGLAFWEKNIQLGNAYINTSAIQEISRARFTLGLLALHNFMYDEAVELFTSALDNERQIAKKDFPMANWGIALASKYMFWSSSDCPVGKQAVIDIPKDYQEQVTEKEASFIALAFALFPPNKECKDDTEDDRETRFTVAAENLLKKFPNDFEGTIFYGLGKLATLNHAECGKGTPLYEECQTNKRALRKILDELSEAQPTHSGLIHYVIHVYDTPTIFGDIIAKFLHEHIAPEDQVPNAAASGIKAAYNYGIVAKSSSHGLHMPTHIFLRTGNWKSSLKSNADSVQVCDKFARLRGKDYSYDRGNLYHSLEYYHNDLIQLGRYKEARKQFNRMKKVHQSQLEASQQKMDEDVRWYLELVYRMGARDMLDPYVKHPRIVKHGGNVNKCLPHGVSVVNDDISAAQMTYAAISEAGAMLASGIAAAKEKKSSIWRICIEEMDLLSEKLEGKKYKGTMLYSKQAVRMMREQLYGGAKLVEAVNSAVEIDDDVKVIKRFLHNATAIQDQMEQTYLTVTLLFVPSYELYGEVLLMLEEYHKARKMFEKSLLTSMGRTKSLVGLARSHVMLGHEDEADYFYHYVKEQLSGADHGNLHLKEIHKWFKNKSPQEIKSFFKWPLV